MNHTTDDTLQAALGYAQIGLPVFPCRLRDEGLRKAKAPYTDHGFKEASTSTEQIKCWWANYPDAIIGLPTGKVSGLVVIDIDPRHGGDYSLQGLIDKHGDLPDTLTAITGGGGTHYYFRYPGREIRCSNSKIASGVDIKADGGYVIAPPSGHESGKNYFWDGDFDLNSVAEMPNWLLKLIDAAGQKKEPTNFGEEDDLLEGRRNEMLAEWAGVLRRYGRGAEEIFAALWATNQLRCKPPMSESEVRAIAKSVSRYEPDQGATISIEGAPDVDLSGITGQNNANTPVSHLVAVPLSTIEAKEIQWFWPNRIPAGMLSLLVGNPGVGKSFLTMYICSHISTGQDWPDAENKIEPGSVLLFSDEESLEYAIKPRLDAHEADCTKIFAVPHIKKADGKPDSFTIDQHIQLLREHLELMPDCRLIIFDPITAYLGAVNANNNAEVRGALIGLQSLAQEKNVTVLGINHFSKKADLDVIHRILGSTGFVAAARAVWAVIQDKHEDGSDEEPARLFIPVKSNYSVAPTTLKFQIEEGRVVFDETEHQVNIDSIMQQSKKNKKNPNLETAKAFLTAELEGRAFGYARDIINKAKSAGISRDILYKAKKQLGVFDWKEGFGHPVKWSFEGEKGV